MRKLFLLLFLNIVSVANASEFDSLFEKSDLVITGYVLKHRIATYPAIPEYTVYEFDFVIFSICAKPDSYSELLKKILPGDTLKRLSFLSLSEEDSLRVRQWYAIPLLRDTLRSSGWKLTYPYPGKGIYGDSALDSCPCLKNYIYSEYGVVEQNVSFKGRWGYTTFTTLDGVIRKQWKYRQAGNRWIEWKSEYSESEKLMRRIRILGKPVGWDSKQVIWVFRDNGRFRLRRTVYRNRL